MQYMVQVTSTFLWSAKEEHPLRTKLMNQERKSLFHQLTDEEAMILFKDKLVDSELLYGEIVDVKDIIGEYAKVFVPKQASKKESSGYPGWVFVSDIKPLPENYSDAEDSIAILEPRYELAFKEDANKRQPVSIGTVLSVLSETASRYEVVTPDGTGLVEKEAAQKLNATEGNAAERLVSVAENFKDLRYVWAGTSSAGFDCSGFVYSLYRIFDIWLSRDAKDQALEGREVSYEEAQPGDLLYFAYEEGKGTVHHVGIYVGEDQMIHSQTPGSKVMVTKLAGTNYEKELCAVRRHFKRTEKSKNQL